MPRTSTVPAVTAIGIDMGKNTLHMVGLDSRGAIVREKVSRGRIALRLANLQPCLIGIEAGRRSVSPSQSRCWAARMR
jgi:transposase